MIQKLTALFLVIVMFLSFTACQKPKTYPAQEYYLTPQEAIEAGDIQAAYDMLFNNDNRSHFEEELFSRFAFVPTEVGNGIKWTYDDNGNITSFIYNENNYSKTEIYSYDDKGNLVFENDGKYDCTYVYNNKNQIISMNWTEGNSSANFLFEYDQNGNLITFDFPKTTDGIYSFQETRKYDANNNLIEVCRKNFYYGEYRYSTTTTLTYDSNNNLSTMMVDDKEEIQTYKYTYDNNNNLINILQEFDSGWIKADYTYDNSGNMLTENISSSGDLWHNSSWSYDYRNNVTHNTYSYYTGSAGSDSYSYEYDRYGNIIKYSCNEDFTREHKYKLVYYPNGIPKSVKKVIDYHTKYKAQSIYHGLDRTLYELKNPYIYNTKDLINPNIDPHL